MDNITKMGLKISIRKIIEFLMLIIWLVGISYLLGHHIMGCVIAFMIIGLLAFPRSFVEDANEQEYDKLYQERWEQWKRDVIQIFKDKEDRENSKKANTMKNEELPPRPSIK